jgi:hypothetical protein
MELKEIGRDGVDWINLAQGTHQWRDPMDKEMNTLVNNRPGIS